MGARFPNLLADKANWQSRKKKDVAIVTPYLVGSINSSGIATAAHALAESLIGAGHSVTLILSNREYKGHRFEFWQEYYLRRGIRLLLLPRSPLQLECPATAARSYEIYLFLRDNHFDIVHFPELLGLGYYSTLAKKWGLALDRTLLCVTVNGPSLWHRIGNQEFGNQDDIACDFLERKSIELADVAFAPSQHILEWVLSRGWRLPKRTFVEQYLLPDEARPAHRGSSRRIKELVFFGRLETRKGLELFFDALGTLPPEVLGFRSLTLLGSPGAVAGRHSTKWLGERLKSGPRPWKTIYDYDQQQALRYLRARDVLVVLPSLSESLGFTAMECLASGIPFIATRIPAFEELIAKKNQARIFFDPNPQSLAKKLEQTLREGIPSKLDFAVSPETTKDRWLRWHDCVSTENKPSRLGSSAKKAEISVIVTHRNRPDLLRQCLRSIDEQTLPPLEVIVMDDASGSPQAVRYLKTLESESRGKKQKIVRRKTSMGPVACRNAGVALARGEYLLFMDDDNVAKADELETFSQVARLSGADIVTCAFDRFEGEEYPTSETRALRRWIPMGDALAYGIFSNIFGDVNSLVRKKSFVSLGGLKQASGAGFEDAEFFARAVIQGCKLVTVPDALFWSRLHDRNFSRTLNQHRGDRHRMSAYHGIFPHPEMHALIESTVRCLPARKWSGEYRRQSIRAITKDFRIIDQKPHFSKRLYVANSESDFRKWKPGSGARFAVEQGHARVEMLDSSGEVRLKTFPIPARRRIMIEVEITAFKKSFFDVKCESINELGKRETAVNGTLFEPGHRKIQIILDAPKLQGPLRIRPSRIPETVFIKRLEVFSED